MLSVVAAVWTLWWSAWSLIFVILAVSKGMSEDVNRGNGVLGGIVLAVLAAMLAGAPAGRVPCAPPPGRRRARRAPPGRARPDRSRLPGKKSAARVPMQRLAEAETALRDLLAQLGAAWDIGSGPSVPGDVVDDAWRTATETAGRLRAIAARVQAVEAAVAHAPADQRAALEDGAHSLLAHLDRGLDGYRELIAAAGQLVLADTRDPLTDELVEATDHLAGLAAALRELSGGQ